MLRNMRTAIHGAIALVAVLALANCGEKEFVPVTDGAEDQSSSGSNPPAPDNAGASGGSGTNSPYPPTTQTPAQTQTPVQTPAPTPMPTPTPTPIVNSPPAYCNDYFIGPFCDIYQHLYGRWPDLGGATYWARDFVMIGVPANCYTRRVAIGTQPLDCERHRAKWGFYPSNGSLCPASPRGDAPLAYPSALCAAFAP